MRETAQPTLSRVTCILSGIVFSAFASTALAEPEAYRLHPGDSLSLSVHLRPDLSGVFRLDERGRLMLPLIGTLTGSGRTAEEIRASVADRLGEHVDGDLQVNVAVEEYRPVYIDGDVAKPGAYPPRAGMTVGIAVALAGGRQSVRSSGSPSDASKEQEQLDLLLDAHRTNVAREARLLAELAGKEDVIFPADLKATASQSDRVREILDNERAIMRARATLQTLQAESLNRRILGSQQVIDELESQKRAVATRRALYEQRLADIESLAGQGMVPKTNLLGLQIEMTTLEQEARQADIRMIESRQALDEARAELANLAVERRATIAADLQAVQDVLSRSDIQFNQSLRRFAVLKAQMPPKREPGFMEPPSKVRISRMAELPGQDPAELQAAWNSPVLPGDVIWVPFPELSSLDAFAESLPNRLAPSGD
jgi:polysaccharide biosynthesis/export protein ExoF